MIAKAKAAARLNPRVAGKLPAGPWLTPPSTMAERVQRIEAMGQRISDYIRFMCAVGGLNGTSGEAKERALTAFYERMVVVQEQLGRIHDELRLE